MSNVDLRSFDFNSASNNVGHDDVRATNFARIGTRDGSYTVLPTAHSWRTEGANRRGTSASRKEAHNWPSQSQKTNPFEERASLIGQSHNKIQASKRSCSILSRRPKLTDFNESVRIILSSALSIFLPSGGFNRRLLIHIIKNQGE